MAHRPADGSRGLDDRNDATLNDSSAPPLFGGGGALRRWSGLRHGLGRDVGLSTVVESVPLRGGALPGRSSSQVRSHAERCQGNGVGHTMRLDKVRRSSNRPSLITLDLRVTGRRHTASMGGALELLLERAAMGDQRAFDALYLATSPRLLGLTARILQDRAQAEEVTQEAFLQAWRQADRFRPERGSAIAWLMQIAHARAVDRVRAVRAQRDRDLLHGARESASWMAPVSDVAEAAIRARQVRKALGLLSSAHREAIVLAYLGGMTHSEIADHLGIPLGTAKTRVRDGMRRLRLLLDVEAPSPAGVSLRLPPE